MKLLEAHINILRLELVRVIYSDSCFASVENIFQEIKTAAEVGCLLDEITEDQYQTIKNRLVYGKTIS